LIHKNQSINKYEQHTIMTSHKLLEKKLPKDYDLSRLPKELITIVSKKEYQNNIISGSADYSIKIWNIYDGTCRTLTDHIRTVSAVAISSDNKLIASGSHDFSIKIWDFDSGDIIRTFDGLHDDGKCHDGYTGHMDYVYMVCFSADNKRVISGGRDKMINIWDLDTGALVNTLQCGSIVRSVCCSSDNKMIASAGANGFINVWNYDNLSKYISRGFERYPLSICFSPDNKRIAIGSQDNKVYIRDIVNDRPVHTLSGHAGSINSVNFSFDNKRIVSGSADKSIKIWDANNYNLVHTLVGHTDHISSVCFSSDNKRIISGSFDKTIKIWDAHTGDMIQTLEGHTDWISSVCLTNHYLSNLIKN